MTTVFTTYSGVSQAAQKNLRFGIAHGKWGLRTQPAAPDFNRSFEWHVIGSRARGLRHGPRSQPSEWVTAIIDVYVFKVRSPIREEQSLFWPDERADAKIYYPHRFDFSLVARAEDVPTAYDSPIPEAISDGIRRAAGRGESSWYVSDEAMTKFVDVISDW